MMRIELKKSVAYKLAVSILFLICCFTGEAQDLQSFKSDTSGVLLVGNPNGQRSSIQLRWIPNSPEAWQLGAKNGYIITRLTFEVNGSKKVVSKSPIKPWPFEKWQSVADTSLEMKRAILGVVVDSTTEGSPNAQEAIKLYREQKLNFGLAMIAANNSIRVAEASGLYFEDKDVKPGFRYLYKIEVAGVGADKFKPTIVEVPCCVSPKLANIIPGNSAFDEKAVTLKWTADASGLNYAYYNVFRKINGKFVKLNTNPLIPNASNQEKGHIVISYVDSIPVSGITYDYKIQGTTLFGTKGEFSKVISGTCLKRLHFLPVISSVKYTTDGSAAIINWSVNKEDESIIKKIEVFKAPAAIHSQYFLITHKSLPPTARTFTDTDLWPSNYYAVKIVGINGDSLASMPFFFQAEDSIPPAPPVRLAAKVDTSWVVQLSWKPNTEKDFHGYRVFKKTSLNGELIRLTSATIKDTIWNDTLSSDNANDEYYYLVSSIDKRYNASKFSEPLLVKIPSRLGPVPPLITKYETTDKGIKIFWEHSPTEDVVKESLYRKGSTDYEWKPLYSLATKGRNKNEVSSYFDSTTIPGKTYIYSLRSETQGGRRSDYGKQIVVNHIDQKSRGAIENFHLVVSREQRVIKLSWEYKPSGVLRFEIYKGQDDKPVELATSVIDGKTEYYDKDIKAGHKYTYKVRAVHSDGASSLMSISESVLY